VKRRRLQHIHAAPAASRVELDEMTWRGDGGTLPRKREIARRIAVCWNVCEGIPTATLEGGVLRDVFEAIRNGDLQLAQSLVAAFDLDVELVAGRPHACDDCIAKESE
jgi:hypothetical protein